MKTSAREKMEEEERRVCKVRTQDPEDLDEEVKSLVSAWRFNLICWFTLSPH